MSAAEPLISLIMPRFNAFSKMEYQVLEAVLLVCVCEEISHFFKKQYNDYLKTIKSDTEMESAMIDANFTSLLIRDILASEAYSLPGIACYTYTPEDVICDLLAGSQSNPTLTFFRKLVELHRSIRPEFYREVIKKLAEDQSVMM